MTNIIQISIIFISAVLPFCVQVVIQITFMQANIQSEHVSK